MFIPVSPKTQKSQKSQNLKPAKISCHTVSKKGKLAYLLLLLIIIIIIIIIIAPAGISPRSEIPRRHPSNSRVY